MRKSEVVTSYPAEIIKQAKMDMISPQKYLRAKILMTRSRECKDDKGVLIRIDRNQGGIYFEESFPTEEEASHEAQQLNLLNTPLFDEQASNEVFLAVRSDGELIQAKKDERKSAPKS